MSELPKTINVTRVISYDVAKVVENILGDRDPSETGNVTIGEVMERVESYCEDDFSCGWGHKNEIDDLIFTDQDGNEI